MKSAKTKAKEFAERFEGEDWAECNIEDKLRILLLEHERDTRYKAIDVIGNAWQDSIGFDEITSAVHNLEVKDGE